VVIVKHKAVVILVSILFALGVAAGTLTVRAAGSTLESAPAPAGLAKATFAGGCFWCMEQPFEALAGVQSAVSGYVGGSVPNVTYAQIGRGTTGHAQAVEVLYDPAKVSYSDLLAVYWVNVDPTVKDRQFCDAGTQYRTAIFVHDPEQRQAADASLARLKSDPRFTGQTLHTQIVNAGPFYVAEDYHQDYAAKNPAQYKYYRWGCGRDARLKQIWGGAPAP